MVVKARLFGIRSVRSRLAGWCSRNSGGSSRGQPCWLGWGVEACDTVAIGSQLPLDGTGFVGVTRHCTYLLGRYVELPMLVSGTVETRFRLGSESTFQLEVARFRLCACCCRGGDCLLLSVARGCCDAGRNERIAQMRLILNRKRKGSDWYEKAGVGAFTEMSR